MQIALIMYDLLAVFFNLYVASQHSLVIYGLPGQRSCVAVPLRRFLLDGLGHLVSRVRFEGGKEVERKAHPYILMAIRCQSSQVMIIS